jgi:hypothetical protein
MMNFNPFLNESRQIIEVPDDIKNTFNPQEKEFLKSIGFVYTGEGKYSDTDTRLHNEFTKSGIGYTVGDAWTYQQFTAEPSSFAAIIRFLQRNDSKTAEKMITSKIKSQAGNNMKAWDSDDMFFFKELGFKPLGYYGILQNPKTGVEIQKFSDGEYRILKYPNTKNYGTYFGDRHATTLGELIKFTIQPNRNSNVLGSNEDVLSAMEKVKDQSKFDCQRTMHKAEDIYNLVRGDK